MRRSTSLVLTLTVIVAAVGAALVVPTLGPPDGTPYAAQPTTAAPVRVAVVGDSLSAGGSGFLGHGLDDRAWMSYADGDGIEYVGGWARAGATPDEMAAAVRPVGDVDVLVVLAGTNAVRTGRTMAQEIAAYERIVNVVRPETVLISAIPPYRAHAAAALVYGEELRQVARDHGWTWVDPWTSARDGDDWAPGFSTDGTHPAGPAQYRVLGESFRRIILESRTLPSALG